MFLYKHLMRKNFTRLLTSCYSGLKKARKTIWWLLKIILPISLLVSFLQYWGVIAYLSVFLKPIFSIIGLPGESAAVFISSMFLPLYGPVAIIATLPLSIREITILAIMCLISHNIFVVKSIQKKTGSSFWIILPLRLITSLTAAFIFNLILPEQLGSVHSIQKAIEFTNIADMLVNWLENAGFLSLKIAVIVSGLMMLQNILREFNILNIISKAFAPFMKVMGLTVESSFLWFVAQTLGLTYGSAVMIEEVENKEISLESAGLLNYHIAINHSLLEDTLIFVAIGVPVLWITIPRIILAMIVVWTVRLITSSRKNKSKKRVIV